MMHELFYGIGDRAIELQSDALLHNHYSDAPPALLVADKHRMIWALSLSHASLFVVQPGALSVFLCGLFYKVSRFLWLLASLSQRLKIVSLWRKLYRGFLLPKRSLLFVYKACNWGNGRQAYLNLCYNLGMAFRYHICYRFSYGHYTAIRRIAP